MICNSAKCTRSRGNYCTSKYLKTECTWSRYLIDKVQWLVRCALIWYWRKHSYFECQLAELHTTNIHGVHCKMCRTSVKLQFAAYGWSGAIPARAIVVCMCVCVCVSMGPATAGTYYLLRSAAWSRSRQLLSNHCPLPCHPATPLRHILS